MAIGFIDLNNMDLKIVYEDNHLLVVVKPANLLSQKDYTNDEDLLNLLKAYLKEKYNKLGNVYLGLVHRLDRRVSGLMVYAKTSKAASRLSETIRNREFIKKYYALFLGELSPKRGVLRHYLKKVETKKGPLAKVSLKTDGEAKEAILEYQVQKSVLIDGEIITLVEVNLITGRYNQIRAQFSKINKPLLNDYKYNYRGPNYGELGLICSELNFTHPTTKEKMSFNYFPEQGIWKKF
ncbi:MAG: RluA family pseudouridine synthase [Bacilli bacterium]|nr:RluA family pseudouridine synthase [Bacilli bacterium]